MPKNCFFFDCAPQNGPIFSLPVINPPSPPATQRDLRNTEIVLRGEMQKMEGGLRGEMQKMEGGLRGEMQNMKTELRKEIHTQGHDLMNEIGKFYEKLEVKIDDLRLHLDFQLEQKFCNLRDSASDKIALVHDRIDRVERRFLSR